MKFRTSIFPLFFALLCYVAANGQASTIEGIELIDTNAIFGVTNAEILGIDRSAPVPRLVYSFVHPGGGVQADGGALKSGGKDATDLRAMGSIELSAQMDTAGHRLQWVAGKGGSTNANFYARPLTDASAHLPGNLIARKGSIMGHSDFMDYARKLSKRAPRYEYKPWEEKAEDGPVNYAPSYVTTTIGLGMGGSISYLTVAQHSLKPEGERNKGLFGTAYKRDIKNLKDNLKTAFGDENISFKMMGNNPQVCDPVSGHVVAFGGIKYKKDKTKDDSHFTEFMLLTFNSKGELVKRVKYDSDFPMKIEEVYPVNGKNLAPDVDEVSKAIFVASGDVDKKMEGKKSRLRRVFVVDMLTGEIVKQADVELKRGNTLLLRSKQLSGGRVQLTYLYPEKDKRGTAFLTIGPDGVEELKEYDDKSPEFQAIQLTDKLFNSLSLASVYTFETPDGGLARVEEFQQLTRDQTGNVVGSASHGFALLRYAPDGKVTGFHGLGNYGEQSHARILWADEKAVLLCIGVNILEKFYPLKLAKFSLVDSSLEILDTPQGTKLPGEEAVFLDGEGNTLYLLGQKARGKGVNVFRVKM